MTRVQQEVRGTIDIRARAFRWQRSHVHTLRAPTRACPMMRVEPGKRVQYRRQRKDFNVCRAARVASRASRRIGMRVGRLIAMGVILAAISAQAEAPPAEIPIKDADGTTMAVAVVCNECAHPEEAGSGKVCRAGMVSGWLKGNQCGACLNELNTEPVLACPYDLHVTGTLVDAKGQPLKSEYVRLLTPFGWSVRSITSDKGAFRLTVGATAQPRKSTKPLIVDIGTQVSSPKGKMGSFTMYLLPPAYKECPPPDAPSKATPRAAPKKSTAH